MSRKSLSEGKESRSQILKKIKPQIRSVRTLELDDLSSSCRIQGGHSSEFGDESLKTVRSDIKRDFELMEHSYVLVQDLPTEVKKLRQMSVKKPSSKRKKKAKVLSSSRRAISIVFAASLAIFVASFSSFVINSKKFESYKQVSAMNLNQVYKAERSEATRKLKASDHKKKMRLSKIKRLKKQERPLQD